LIAAVRNERLDAAIVSLPDATKGLRMMPLGHERAVAALPVSHRHAVQPAIRLEQVATERIVVLPRGANRPFYDAVLAACQKAGVSPSLVETSATCVEPALLAVALGAGAALLPASVADRCCLRGVRSCPLRVTSPSSRQPPSRAANRRTCPRPPSCVLSRTRPDLTLASSRFPVTAAA
jgi:DNA-binding transcriptional LysR family regulator